MSGPSSCSRPIRKALYGIGKVLDRLNRPDEATAMYRRSREMTGR